MTGRRQPLPAVPETTAVAVRPPSKGALYVDLRTEFGRFNGPQLFAKRRFAAQVGHTCTGLSAPDVSDGCSSPGSQSGPTVAVLGRVTQSPEEQLWPELEVVENQ